MGPEVSRCLVPWRGDAPVWVRRLGLADLDLLAGWLDAHIRDDYFFRRSHLAGILARPSTDSWGVECGGDLIGVAILHFGRRLHNLYLAREWRGVGLGAALLALFRPQTVRAKTNMVAADPTGFYEREGYRVVGQDPRRPHILEMERVSEDAQKMTAPNAPGSTIPPPGGIVDPPKSAPRRPLGMFSTAEVSAVAAKLRGLTDDELVAVAYAAQEYNLWQTRQKAARDRRIERERLEAAKAAGQHLSADLTGEARARVAKARAMGAVGSLFTPSANGTPNS